MRAKWAYLWRQVFRIPLMRQYFYAFHKYYFEPYKPFRGVKIRSQIDGINLELEVDDWVQENLYFSRGYETAELTAVQRLVQQGDTVIDVGANIGWYTLHLAQWVGDEGQVISLEPYGQNYEALTRNIALNSYNNIQTEKLALSDHQEVLTFYHDPAESNRGMVTTQPTQGATTEQVQACRLDDHLREQPVSSVDFIKIDIEGHEYPALLGMQETLTQYSPKLMVEMLQAAEHQEQNQKIEALLEFLNYQKYYVGDDGELSTTAEAGQRENFIFIKKT